VSVGQYSSPELEVCAAYPLGTTPILFWMSTMETDVVGMEWNIPLRTNQRRGRDNPSDVVGVKRPAVLIGGNTLIPSANLSENFRLSSTIGERPHGRYPVFSTVL